MDEIGALAKQIDREHIVAICDNTAFLQETEAQATLRCVKLSGLHDVSLVLKTEGLVGRFFSIGCPARKCCDFIVLTKVKSKLHLLFIELKSSKPNNDKKKDIRLQMLGAECAMYYCGTVMEKFFGLSSYLKPFEQRYFVFYAQSGNKQRTSPGKNTYPANNPKTPHFVAVNASGSYPIRIESLLS